MAHRDGREKAAVVRSDQIQGTDIAYARCFDANSEVGNTVK